MGRMGWLENWEIEAFNWIEWNTSSTGSKTGKFMFLIEWNTCAGSKTGILNPTDLLHILATK